MNLSEDQYQTPMPVANYMASLLPFENAPKILHFLEPTPGIGNLFNAAKHKCGDRAIIHIPVHNFFDIDTSCTRYDAIIMNPPFSKKSAFGVPEHIKGMRVGYHILKECMKMSDNVIALMPWFTLLDSDVRMRELKAFGIKSLTTLPRKTFQYTRIQTLVIELVKGYKLDTVFKTFDY